MSVFSEIEIVDLYTKYGIVPPSESDSIQVVQEKQNVLYKKQMQKLRKLLSNSFRFA